MSDNITLEQLADLRTSPYDIIHVYTVYNDYESDSTYCFIISGNGCPANYLAPAYSKATVTKFAPVDEDAVKVLIGVDKDDHKEGA